MIGYITMWNARACYQNISMVSELKYQQNLQFMTYLSVSQKTWTRKYQLVHQLVQFSLIFQKLLILLIILCCCGSWNITMAFVGSHYNFLKIIYIGENNIQ